MESYATRLHRLQQAGNLRTLPQVIHEGKFICTNGRRMLNLSSNDYLGLSADERLYAAFMQHLAGNPLPFSSSSSRLLTGNHSVYTELETLIAAAYRREAALLFNSGYHANVGVLPAVADKQTLILADKLVHASIIDGIRLSGAPFVRYRHNDFDHLEQLLRKEYGRYSRYIIVTESIFSMDGDVADLRRLAALKERYPDTLLYVDEAHAVGVRGENGLGVAEETGCTGSIDWLVGTFGKALASVGAYVVCSEEMKRWLVNTMRPLIFSTALPPVNVAWSRFVFERLPGFREERCRLAAGSALLNRHIGRLTGEAPGVSHIVPFVAGENDACIRRAQALQEAGFYVLPVRPPTVPPGTSRLRFSLTANLTLPEMERLIRCLE